LECGASMETRSQPSSLSGGQAEGNSSTAGSPAMYACTARRRHRNSSSGSRTASAAQCVSAARRRWLGCRAPARSTAASAMKHDILCALCTATHVRRCTKTICGTHPKCDPNSATEHARSAAQHFMTQMQQIMCRQRRHLTEAAVAATRLRAARRPRSPGRRAIFRRYRRAIERRKQAARPLQCSAGGCCVLPDKRRASATWQQGQELPGGADGAC